MDHSNVVLFDLPTELLLSILNKFNHMDILYSLWNVYNQRLNIILQQITCTQPLNFFITKSDDDEILPMSASVLDRFCIDILPQIDHHVKSLVTESESVDRILGAAIYPHLTQLKIFNMNDNIVSHCFKVESPFRHMFQEQITDLSLIFKKDEKILSMKQYPNGVHGYILSVFKNLKYLSICGYCTILSLPSTSSTSFCFPNLQKLCADIRDFETCRRLLDGRLKHLTILSVIIHCTYLNENSSIIENMDGIPNLKSFSLTCVCRNDEYDTQILPLLRHMSNLEELTLHIDNGNCTTLVDGTHIQNHILVHMPRLHKFNFHIRSHVPLTPRIQNLSSDAIQQTFTNIGYQNVACILYNIAYFAVCHVFSLPFFFNRIEYIGNTLPPIVFSHVTDLCLFDKRPFEHEFFVRVAHSFPLLKKLSVHNLKRQSQTSENSIANDNQLYSSIEYPHLMWLCLKSAHIDYVEQFLNQTKTHLPNLVKMRVDYDKLIIATENFTRDTTRLNCAQVKDLIIDKTLVQSKELYDYFPSLLSFRCSLYMD